MLTRTLPWLALTTACGGAGATPRDAAVPDAFDRGTTTSTATKEGAPAWEITGVRLFTAIDSFDSQRQVFSLHGFNEDQNTFVPRIVHAPPYDTEVPDHIAAAQFPSGNKFLVSDWTTPQGIQLAAVIIPSANAPTGTTADYASGPYIPKDLELVVDEDVYNDTTDVDPGLASIYPALTTVVPGTTADGWSHMALTFGESTQYIPGTPGHYRLHLHLSEVKTPANGWQIDVPFDVE